MLPFRESLRHLISCGADSPLLVHSDMFRARAAIVSTSAPQIMLARHIEALEDVAADRPLWFPAFNYDFTQTRVYRPSSDVSQVGALTEYVRTQWATWRCGPPVFNFCGKSGSPPAVCSSGEVDPFDEKSLFAVLHRSCGNVLMYGAPFSTFTAIHYVERLSGGPLYRYDKLFPGVIEEPGNMDLSVQLRYHVRPMGRRLEYDWPRLQADAEAMGLVRSVKVPGSEVMHIRFAELCDYWLERLREDPLFLLDKETRNWVMPELDKFGRCFVITDFE